MVIVAMTAMSFHPGFSKPKKNAKTNTKANVADLHSATRYLQYPQGHTVKCKGNKLQRRIR